VLYYNIIWGEKDQSNRFNRSSCSLPNFQIRKDRGPDRSCSCHQSLNFLVFLVAVQSSCQSFSSFETGLSNTTPRRRFGNTSVHVRVHFLDHKTPMHLSLTSYCVWDIEHRSQPSEHDQYIIGWCTSQNFRISVSSSQSAKSISRILLIDTLSVKAVVVSPIQSIVIIES
jgi:hypothetical protein